MAVLAAQHIRLRRWGSTKKALHSENLINIGPVDSKARTSNFPMFTIPMSGVQKTRIPSSRHGDGAAECLLTRHPID